MVWFNCCTRVLVGVDPTVPVVLVVPVAVPTVPVVPVVAPAFVVPAVPVAAAAVPAFAVPAVPAAPPVPVAPNSAVDATIERTTIVFDNLMISPFFNL